MMYRNSKRKGAAIGIVALLAGLGIWTIVENKNIKTTTHEIRSEKISLPMPGLTIVHISDFHNTRFGENHKEIVDKIKASKPDFMVITGDLIDSRKTNVELAVSFVEEILKISPVYYVTGNHESRVPEYTELRAELLRLGVLILENDGIDIIVNNQQIQLSGVQDPAFYRRGAQEGEKALLSQQLEELEVDNGKYSILLSHRPEYFDLYSQKAFDLILSGHAHGGQVRLPFVGGILAPNQGFFPRYTSGLYQKGKSQMIVSRGLGNSQFPLRVNNPPELVIIKLLPDRP